MHIAIVFNPGSGVRAATQSVGIVTSALASHNHTFEVFDRLAEPDFERNIQRSAQEFDRVVVIGGDGTLNGVINGVLASANPELPVAFVPTGRGKDTSRALNSWKPDALRGGAFETASPIATDLVHMELASGTERYAINIANIGVPAHAAIIANGLPRLLGSLSYVLGAGRAIFPRRAFSIEMTIDDTPVSIENALLVSICNGKAFGGGIYIAPEADQRDGLLDIATAANAHLGDLLLQLPRLKSGEPFEHRALQRWRGSEVIIEPVNSTFYEIDGERLSSQPLRLRSAPGAVQWIGPE